MDRRILVHVSAFLKNWEGRYLLLQRSRKSSWGPLLYDLPGGRMEWGETPEETLMREVMEEIGCPPEDLRFLGLRTGRVQVGDKDYHIVMLHYLGRFNGKIKLSGEHEGFEWMSPTEIENADVEEGLKKFAREIFK